MKKFALLVLALLPFAMQGQIIWEKMITLKDVFYQADCTPSYKVFNDFLAVKQFELKEENDSAGAVTYFYQCKYPSKANVAENEKTITTFDKVYLTVQKNAVQKVVFVSDKPVLIVDFAIEQKKVAKGKLKCGSKLNASYKTYTAEVKNYQVTRGEYTIEIEGR